MRRARSSAWAGALSAVLVFGCARNEKPGETVPVVRIDRIFVDKSEHKLTVYRASKAVRTFKVALGAGGLAPKTRQGDELVPEGWYFISGRNPSSAYHLALRISYPTPQQVAAATARGINPGGDIMIHGLPNGSGWAGRNHRRTDWTSGCIAVTNDEIEWLWKAVPDGTPIEIVA